jgi:hypothetical protein
LLNASPDDAASWEQVSRAHQSYDSPELRACHTPSFLAAAAQLSEDPLETIGVPKRAYAINVFPSSGEWKWPRPHIDHAIKEHLHKTFPRAFRIATMTFLSDVPPHGGGTVVWPGSHAVLERLAKSDPERFEMMWTLNQELPHVTLADPVELTPKRGDVLFYSYLCAHAGSQNTSDRPRLALNAKWCDVNRDARTVCFVPLANGKGWTDFDNPRVALYAGSDYTVEAQHTKTPPKLGGAAVVATVDLLHRGIGEMNYDYDLMSFQTAKKRGLPRYFTGKPCPPRSCLRALCFDARLRALCQGKINPRKSAARAPTVILRGNNPQDRISASAQKQTSRHL